MKLLTVDTIDQAREKLRELLRGLPRKSEMVSLEEGCGRILAEDFFVKDDIPAFNRSTVDGYAVVATDTAGAGETIPVFLKQMGTVSMGKPALFSIQSGECAYVPTGGMIPAGADAVVMVEYCEDSGGSIAVYEAVAAGSGIALAGEDIKKGSLLLRRGMLIRPQETGAMAAAGLIRFPVFVPPKFSIISTGDELVPPSDEPRQGEIRDINSSALRDASLRRGYTVVSSQIVHDDEALLEAAIREVIASSDVVLVSGGSSQGEKDSTAKVINRVAKSGVFTQGLALKPGKPTILGWDEETHTLLAGLPGHPVAALIVFELLFVWLFDELFDRQPPFLIPARISCNIPGSPGRAVCQPVILHLEEDAARRPGTEGNTPAYSAEPIFGKSGMITTLTKADGYIIIDLNKEGLKKDECVMVHLL